MKVIVQVPAPFALLDSRPSYQFYLAEFLKEPEEPHFSLASLTPWAFDFESSFHYNYQLKNWYWSFSYPSKPSRQISEETKELNSVLRNAFLDGKFRLAESA